jgi:hypothetical protein
MPSPHTAAGALGTATVKSRINVTGIARDHRRHVFTRSRPYQQPRRYVNENFDVDTARSDGFALQSIGQPFGPEWGIRRGRAHG